MKPHVICLMAVTLDGRIGTDSDHFPDWTGKADKKKFMEITKSAGVVVFGKKTYDTIGRPLPGRKNIILTRQKIESEHDNSVFTDDTPAQIIADCQTEGFDQVIVAGGQMINTIFAPHIDEIWVSICPNILGSGLSIFDDSINCQMELIDLEKIDDNTIFARYKILK